MINEKVADFYSKIYKINCIGLRFFTVFGPWGRPDMFIMKLLIANKSEKLFELNNSGNHYRDFTSINDVNFILEKLCSKKTINHQIFNVCSNSPVFIKSIVKFIKKHKGNLNINNVPKNKTDVYKTHGDNSKIINFLKLKKFSHFKNELKKNLDWFDSQNIL